EGKTIRLVVGFGPGGGYDSYARLLGRHFGQFLPGKPRVVVENMPGAGSFTAVRWLDGPAPKDGTAIVAFNPGLITQSILDPKKMRNVNFANYAWLGNLTRDQRVCYVWAAKGIKTFEAFRNGPPRVFGVPAPGVASWVNIKTMEGLLGLKTKIIAGYKGSADIRIAIERGELDGDCGAWTSIPQEWTDGKKIVPLLKFSEKLPEDAPKDVTYARDLLKSDDDRAVLDVLAGAAEIGRPYIASLKVPEATVAALRKAFDAAANSAGIKADSQKARLPLDPMTAVQVLAELKKIYGASPQAVARAKAMMAAK
ncbi:MAG: Bug family tripartite tricarboxylate transporter substrate binding protein, partial [Beijerinckiaceae bacterium]